MHGNLGPNMNTNKCDVLIAVGMRFDDRVTGNLATYAKQAKVIHFDIDPAEINKNVHADVAVLGNCKETLSAVTALLQPNEHKNGWIVSMPYEHGGRRKGNPSGIASDGRYAFDGGSGACGKRCDQS